MSEAPLASDTLEAWLRARPLPDADTCAEIIAALLRALEPLHEAGEIQHSLDPRAIRLATAEQAIGVVDLGPRWLPEHPPGTLIRDGQVHLNLRYLSPTLVRGKPLDEQHDLFIVATFLYELVTGIHPFPGDSDLERMNALLSGPERDVATEHPELLAIALLVLKPPVTRPGFTANSLLLNLHVALEELHERQHHEAQARLDLARAQARPDSVVALEKAARDRILPMVHAGLWTRDQIVERAIDALLETEPAALSPFEGRAGLVPFVRGLCARTADQLIAELVLPEDGDCARLDRAFDALNARGIVARQAIGWTWRGGLEMVLRDEVPEVRARGTDVRGHAFFHESVVMAALDGSGLEIGFGSRQGDPVASAEIGREIVTILRSFGLAAQWSGDRADPIEIQPFRWIRPLPSHPRPYD